MKKKLIALLALTTLLVGPAVARETVDIYRERAKELKKLEIIDTADIDMDYLRNRNGRLIIEECIGVVTSEKGDGEVLNAKHPDYDYISYRDVPNANVGDVVLTYFIFNPETNYEDDIMLRYDYIID